jgi:quercetin dioxygenase-like cupin family protein
MTTIFRRELVLLILLLAQIPSLSAKAQPGPILIGHDKVAAAFARGGPLLETNNFKIQAGRREAPGLVEIHARDTDIFYVLEGAATLVTGGKAVEPKTISGDEVRAKEIAGGESRHLVKGDVIVIPKGVPHWFKHVNGPFLYYVVKVTD